VDSTEHPVGTAHCIPGRNQTVQTACIYSNANIFSVPVTVYGAKIEAGIFFQVTELLIIKIFSNKNSVPLFC